MALDTTSLPPVLQLEPAGEGRFRTNPADGGAPERNVMFGGQILAQMITASELAAGGKEVKSIHALFARPGRLDVPAEYEVESMHGGRAFASNSVTLTQEGKLLSRGLLLLNAIEPDLIRHGLPSPPVPGPGESRAAEIGGVFPGTETRMVGAALDDPAASPGPAEFHCWIRLPQLSAPPPVNQAMLSWATVGLLIATAMRPHASVDISQAHHTISTGVLGQTVHFHDYFAAGEWLLLSHESIYAGRGRTHGRGLVYTEDGRLVASFNQDNMVRSLGESQGGALDHRRAL